MVVVRECWNWFSRNCTPSVFVADDYCSAAVVTATLVYENSAAPQAELTSPSR